MTVIIDVTRNLVVDYRARGEWCQLPYPNHPKGCPNYGKKFNCPPNAPRIEDWCDVLGCMWFVCVPFDIGWHSELMLLRHPSWTERQARCLLYWQPKVNKELELETYSFAQQRNRDWTYCPEAMGVNVIETARRLGLPIESRPQKIVYKISLVARHNETNGIKNTF